MTRIARHSNIVVFLALCLTLVACALRLCGLPNLPPGLWYDEAYNAVDSLWMLETGSPQVFFWANNGREPMLHYLGAVAMGVLGSTPYVFRLVSALVAILTIPLTYKWVAGLFADDPNHAWLGLIAAAGLCFSFWYQVMSRTGHRTVLFPFFAMLTMYLFWRGWQKNSLAYYAGAGVALGLCQYTYLLARGLPLIFFLFALAWTLVGRRSSQRLSVSHLWLGLLVMGICAALFFLPLGLFFARHPTAFFSRTTDVFVLDQITRGNTNALKQILDAVRVFVDASDPNWRHNLVGQAGFDWLSLVGFWVGLVVVMWRIRRPAYLFLLICLFVMWLPAILSVPAAYTLRLSGLLPVAYTVMAIGLLVLADWLSARLFHRPPPAIWPKITVLVLVVVISGGLTTYNYFVRWANTPMVYSQYNGPLADLAEYVSLESQTNDILLPLRVYKHPTVYFLLHKEFPESETLPAPSSIRRVKLFTVPEVYLIPNMVNVNPSGSYVWLTRDQDGKGIASVLQTLQPDSLDTLSVTAEFTDFCSPRTGETVAQITSLENMAAVLLLSGQTQPVISTGYEWEGQVRLSGFQVLPDLVQTGQSPVLNLYWTGLTGQPREYKTFIHLVSGQGQPISQWDGISLSEEQRWREGKTSPEQHVLWMGPEATPGPYLVRIGLIDPDTGHRLQVYDEDGFSLGDQVQLGLFYVGQAETDPRIPQTTLQAHLDDGIELLGYSILSPFDGPVSKIRLHWQATGEVEGNYTIFVQLLDSDNHLITSRDSEPLAGQYPTSQWRVGDVVVDEFELSLPIDLAPGTYRLVTGMYDFNTGARLTGVDDDGRSLPDNAITLTQLYVE